MIKGAEGGEAQTSTHSSAESHETSTGSSPLEEFTGGIEPTEVTPVYKLATLVVAVAMVLLPAIYIGLIGLAGYAVYYHAVHNVGIMSGSGGGTGRLIVYLGPIVIGGILVVFMIKPLFARKKEQSRPMSLRPEDEPQLFGFIEHICRLVRAPVPTRVDLDCQVNASASFRRGFASMVGNDLVLTIGMPLVAGLNMREFGGVLAHEFGHFAQGAGMRMSYVIRSVSFWFARVVYERDSWDVQLEHAARNSDLRIGIVLHGARLFIWLTRRVLWVLMMIGNALSCFLLRQMEYDADSYECKVAGSDSFASTARQLRRLSVATQMAIGDLQQSWQSGRLVDNFPALIRHKAETLPAEVDRKLEESAATATTDSLDTHPSDADRVRAADAIASPGVFGVTEPATALFSDFSAVSCKVTRHYYETVAELDLKDARLVDADEAVRESIANTEANAALQQFLHEVDIFHCPVVIKPEQLRALPDAENSLSTLRQSREEAQRLKEPAGSAFKSLSPAHERLLKASHAGHLLAAGFSFEAGVFDLTKNTPDAAAAAAASSSEQLSRLRGELTPFSSAVSRRIAASLQLLDHPDGVAGLTEPEALRREAAQLVPVLARVANAFPALQEMQRKTGALGVLAQNIENHAEPGRVQAEMEVIAVKLRRLVAEVQASLAGEPVLAYPFSHARGEITLAEFARSDKRDGAPIELAYNDATAHAERLFTLYFRVLGRLAWMAAQVESRVCPAQAETAQD